MRNILLAVVVAAAVVAAAAENPSSAFIQRTMKMLEASTAENPAHVRVLFYGQSITAQAWTKIVQKQLEARYPTAKFEFRNAAIGGYVSSALIRTADHDLYPWYPDLLFFHVYGPMDKYEEIVKRVRERTSAEIVIWTSHLNSLSKEKPNEINTSHDERAVLIRTVAPKYDCMLIDLREKWRRHLADNGIAVKDLLSDTVHLNPKGCDLYAKLIGEELMRTPKPGDNPTAAGTITSIAASAPEVTRSSDSRLTLRFTGNRVLAVSDGTGAAGAKAKVLLDGKPMDGIKELWAISRPSVGPAKIWMPAINNIAFEQSLMEEDWTLTCLPDSTPDGKKIHFKVQGSVTGKDGEGWNTERFVSHSRRVIIEPSDWQIAWTLGYKKATLPEGFKVTWRSYPLFARVYEPMPAGTRTLLVQGCANQPHTLTLIPEGGTLGISGFVVHAPATRPTATGDNQAAGSNIRDTVNYARPFEPPTRPAFIALPPGAVEPAGWLRDWCLAARDGYTGHMDEVHEEFQRAWAADHTMTGERLNWPKGGWPYEGGGYWFDGLVRLGYALHDDALIKQAKKRLDVVATHMNPNSIVFLWWLNKNKPDDVKGSVIANAWPMWANGLLGRALAGYYAASGDKRVLQALEAGYSGDRDWLRLGWGMSNPWPAFDTYTWTGNKQIAAALTTLFAKDGGGKKPGGDSWNRYRQMPDTKPGAEKNDHVVHFLESTTPWALGYLWTGNREFLDATLAWHDLLARDAMQPSGVPVADEFYGPTGAYRGTETCDVAGYVWSQIGLLTVSGQGRIADRVERAFFNAGPATVARDFKTHVYFQSPNRIVDKCPPYPHGPKAEGNSYAKTHYPLCCTAALNRTVPWYVTHMWMATYDNGLAATHYGPCKVTALAADRVPVEIVCRTDYPFSDVIAMTVKPARAATFPLSLRIPGWCKAPELRVNGSALDATPGANGFVRVERLWKPGDTIRLRFPMSARVQTGRDNNAQDAPYASVSYGPLLFALPIPETKDANTPDPAAKWNYALDVQKAGISVERQAMPAKWNWPLKAPLRLRVNAVRCDWSPTPQNPLPPEPVAKSKSPERITLVPYGCTKFRVSMFPVAADAANSHGRTSRLNTCWPAFDYDGKPAGTDAAFSTAIVAGSKTTTAHFVAESRTMTAADGKMQVRLDCRNYKNFPADEYAVVLTNLSKAEPTGITSNFRSLKLSVDKPESAKAVALNVLRGSMCKATDFIPESFTIEAGKEQVLTTNCGRSSNDYVPFLELNLDDKNGYLFAVGWTGSWKARFANTGKAVEVEIGMERTNFRLLPGETIRQPSVLVFARKNQTRREFKTLLHRFMIENKVPRDSKGQVIPPILAVASGGGNKTPQMMADILRYCVENKMPFDTYWVDAGWYGAPHEDELFSNCGPNWGKYVGDWQVNTTTHPTGDLLPIANAVHKAGLKFLLWFEPERMTDSAPILKTHPEYRHGQLVDFGNPDALKWIQDTIYEIIAKHRIDVYRQDFNMDPGPVWRKMDAPDRVGIAEAKHITGMYRFLDDMRARFPDILQENCASGGRRIDMEMIARAHTYCRSDYYIGRKPKDAAFILGQNATLNLMPYLPFQGCEFNCVPVGDDYAAFSIISSGTVITPSDFDGGILRRKITADETAWFKKVFDVAVRMRPFYMGDFHPLTDETGAGDDVWCAWQCDRPDLKSGFAIFFRRGAATEESRTFELGGIAPNAEYEVEIYDGSKKTVRSSELKDWTVKLKPRSFQLVFYQKR